MVDTELEAVRMDWLRLGLPYTVECTNKAGKRITYMVAPRSEVDYAEALNAAIDAAIAKTKENV